VARARIKICGVTTADALVAAIDAGADAVGLVFVAASPRALTGETAAALAARGPHMLKVGLFADADDAAIAAGVAAGRLGAIQLHGAETPARVAAVRARFGLPVWKAWRPRAMWRRP
jgi:phosphoribosylanthranilate isomerase